MKKKFLFGLSACCVLACVLGLMMVGGKKAQAVPSDEGISYKTIEGHYREIASMDLYIASTYTIYNVSPTNSLTLGNVYLVAPDGTRYTWGGLSGISVPPLGSSGFDISQTGIPLLDPMLYGSWLVGVCWNGDKEDVKIVGWVGSWKHSTWELLSMRTIYPFSGAIG